MNLTHDDVEEILRLLDASTFDELRVETERFTLTLRRGAAGGWTQQATTLRTAESAVAGRKTKIAGASSAVPLEPGVVAVFPPLVGTFYRAPKPGAPPFVEVGSDVAEDTVIAIIETMKLMNSVRAGAKGTIIDICAENGEFVEQERVLMKVRLSSS